jgi:hypothetical protein
MLYYPLLRTKKGEINALTTLSPQAVSSIRPILQVPPPDRDAQGELVAASSEYITKVANTLQAVLAPGSLLACYLDPAPAGLPNPLLGDLLFAIANTGGTPQPVYNLIGSTSYARLYRQLMGAPKEAIIRVRLKEIGISLLDDVKDALFTYQLTSHQTFVLLDAGNISSPDFATGIYEMGLKGTIDQLASLGLAGIILASCALPESLETVAKWKPTKYIRKETEFFRRLKVATKQHLQFSDYATGTVNIEPNVSRIGSPKVRYTLPEFYEVLKGQQVGRTPQTMSDQYHRISQHIVKLPEYPGRYFSWGDDFIYKASQGGVQSRGNATTWVSVSTSHHLELVASMLPAM